MRGIVKKILFIFSLFIFSVVPVSASVNTNQRTTDNYLVDEWVVVTDSNRDIILKTPSVDAKEKIYDYADLFTDSEEEELYSLVINYIDDYDMDLAIVTIDSNNKASSMDYADDFYDYNSFGIGSGRDGVLFLIDMQNRQIWMSTCGRAINMYNDNRINNALDSVYTYMSNEEYYYGVSRYVLKIGEYASSGYPSNRNNSLPELTLTNRICYSIIGSFIITLVVMIILIRRNKLSRKATTAGEFLDKNSVVINRNGDILISSNTVRHRIEHDTSGSSGGSSTHSSSSGSSHGGGGHSF